MPPDFTRIRALWTYLSQGADTNPPLGYILSMWSEKILGVNELGLRFPSVVGFWIMALCLYVYLRRRIQWCFALAGMLLTALTAAGRYSYEARPYAVTLAFAGIALVAWQAAAEPRRRAVALPALAIALASALCSSTFAVTLALPFITGEVIRTVRRARVDWPVWLAFAASAPAVAVLWKLKTAGNVAAYWRFIGNPSMYLFTTYVQLLGPALAPLGLAILLLLVLHSTGKVSVAAAVIMPSHEIGALIGFALIPFIAVPLSNLGGMYFLRYSLNCVIGLAGLAVVTLFATLGNGRLSGATLLTVFGVAFVTGQFLPEEKRPDFGLKIDNTSERIQRL